MMIRRCTFGDGYIVEVYGLDAELEAEVHTDTMEGVPAAVADGLGERIADLTKRRNRAAAEAERLGRRIDALTAELGTIRAMAAQAQAEVKK